MSEPLDVVDNIISEIFERDLLKQGFVRTDKGYRFSFDHIKRAQSRGGFTMGQLVHKGFHSGWKDLTFDDITGVPYRSMSSRFDADLSTEIVKGLTIPNPLISSNMQSVTGTSLAIAMAQMGSVGVLHQFCTDQEQALMIKNVKAHIIEPKTIDTKTFKPSLDRQNRYIVGAAVGVREGNIKRAKTLIDAGVDFIVVDIAHGHSDHLIEAIKKIKQAHDIPIVAGNVVTPKGALELINAGADALKVGVGPGAACTTRMVTGYGRPQISAIYDTFLIAKEHGVKIMADGGMRNTGDMIKALAAGADTIMCGSLYAGTTMSNEFKERILEQHDGIPRYIKYYGSASAIAKKKQGRHSFDAPEGREVKVTYRGPTDQYVAKLITGLCSGISYSGRSRNPQKQDEHPNIARLRSKSRWKLQSQAGSIEGTKGIKELGW